MSKKEMMMIRMSSEEKKILRKKASEFGFESVSDYLRLVGMNCVKIKQVTKVEVEK